MAILRRFAAVCFAPAAFALAGCGGGGPCTLGAAADLPVTTQHHAYYTDITINNGQAHLQVDTGAFANVLSEAAATRLGMTQQMLPRPTTLVGVGTGNRLLGLAMSDRVQVGAAHGEHVAFMTTDAAMFAPGIDGQLGMDFMAKYDDDLDFAGGHVRLVAAHGDCSTPASPLPQPVYSVPLLRNGESDSPAVEVSIHGVKMRAVIDTGAVTTLLFRPAAERIGLPVDALFAASSAKVGGAGRHPARAALGWLNLPVQVGGLELNHMPVAIADQRGPGGVDLLLGYDFVTLVHVWLSHSSHSVLMQYPARPTPVAR
jgi:predicted aspartyl protease